ncbi:putative UPF0481 protein At3g02645 [Carex rostrata]
MTIRQIMNDELEIEHDQAVSIFEVPKPLLTVKPELYVPQILSLGPYHHFREEVQHMERYKIASAKRVQNELREMMRFQDLVDMFGKLEYHIRAHYHRHLNFTGQALAWMMAIHASFLFEFLQLFAKTKKKSIQRIPSRMIHLLFDSKHRTTAHSMIIRDIIMIENQIPLFLLLKIADAQIQLHQMTEEIVADMLVGFFKEISPFKNLEIMHVDIRKYQHLLDFLYCNIVPRYQEETSDPLGGDECGEQDNLSPTFLHNFSGLTKSFISDRIETLRSLIIKILLRIMGNIPMLPIILNPVEKLLSSEKTKDSERSSEPLLEEILIPSVTELTSAGIKICPTSGGISTVDFCTKTTILHLPVISLDINSEVVLRNMVAYEASFGSTALVLSRYIEFMNGIIDTEEDARLLRKKGIILNYLKSDKDVAEMWNGMTRSIRLTRVPQLDCIIEEINKFYNSKWRVILKRFFMRHEVLSLWKNVICVVFALAIVLLFIMGLEVLCLTPRCRPMSRSALSP